MRNTKQFLIAFSIFFSFGALVLAQSSVIVGVLEDGPGDSLGAQHTRDVRVLFRKSGQGWNAYPSNCADQACLKAMTAAYPKEISWTIAFDGRNLGALSTRTPEEFGMYWRVGQQQIAPSQQVPTIGKRTKEFGGFLDAEVYRPLVAVSQPNFKDPDEWKAAQISAQKVLSSLRKKFRQGFPKLCKNPENEEERLKPYAYHDQDIQLVKSYHSVGGWGLARLHVEATDCEDSEAGFGLADPWYVVDPSGSVRYLGSGMLLVDAGDYDGDGKSELLFSIEGQNLGGYRIYYDNFKKSAEFRFNYH
jgi:hypothetical protein